MSVDDLTDWFKLTAYFSGDCTPAEREAFERWLGAVPARRQFMNKLRVIWDASNRQPDMDREAAITYVMVEIRRMGALPEVQDSGELRADGAGGIRRVAPRTLNATTTTGAYLGTQPLPRGLWSAALAIGLGLVVLVVGWTAGVRRSNRRATQASLVYTTGNGERATITLPDGGTVALNVASRLDVPVDYMTGHHTVRLVGEGLFTVPHQEGAPFTVLAGATTARVLGTSFVVRRYATDTATLVAVWEGKVAVGATVVTAAHLVEVGRAGVPRVRPSDASPFAFATGVLTLTGVSLSAAIAELDRWYDADIRLGTPSVEDHAITGEFPAGSLADLTNILEYTLAVRVVRDGRVLRLFPRK